ncbi:MAG: hypothetical protein NT150_02890 [Bacteroidetes bacterium]|nr:hypothetical protein [Bacteroidota bacterium]
MLKSKMVSGVALGLVLLASCKKEVPENTNVSNESNKGYCLFINPIDSLSYKTEAAITKTSIWIPGQTIKIKFLDGTSFQQEKVKLYSSEWLKYANLKFQWVATTEIADIKISFDATKGSWSHLGTRCTWTSQTSASMNYDLITPTTSESLIKRGVLHEFGHALGLIHEHQSPASTISWNKQAVYDAHKSSPNYSKADIDQNFFYPASASNYSEFDKYSVMIYEIPSAWTTDGFFTTANSELSTMDKKYIAINYPFPGVPWSTIFFGASDVGVGANGTVWTLGNVPEPGGAGFGIYKSVNGGAFNKVYGAAVKVDVDPSGIPWVINSNGTIYRGNEKGQFYYVDGNAKDIGIGSNGSVYMVGTVGASGYGVYKWGGVSWIKLTGATTAFNGSSSIPADVLTPSVVRISVDNRGIPWVVDVNGNVFYSTRGGGEWYPIKGALATDIGCGPDGSVYITTRTATNGGYTIMKLHNNQTWISYSGAAVNVDVGPNGVPYVINDRGSLYKYLIN